MSTGTLTASGAATAASFAATGGGVSTGSVVCGDVTSSGTVSAPQLFASNTLTVTNTSEEGAGDAHVVVVGGADAHHQVGGPAQPVPAAEGVVSPKALRVMA